MTLESEENDFINETKPLTFDQAAQKVQQQFVPEDRTVLINKAYNQVIDDSALIQLAFTAFGDEQIKGLMKDLKIVRIMMEPNTVFTIRDVMNFMRPNWNYGRRYTEILKLSNSMYDAELLNRTVGPDTEYIFSSLGTNPALVADRVNELTKFVEFFQGIIDMCSEKSRSGALTLKRCPLPVGRDHHPCSAAVIPPLPHYIDKNHTVMGTHCSEGHWVECDFANSSIRLIRRDKGSRAGNRNRISRREGGVRKA